MFFFFLGMRYLILIGFCFIKCVWLGWLILVVYVVILCIILFIEIYCCIRCLCFKLFIVYIIIVLLWRWGWIWLSIFFNCIDLGNRKIIL